MTSFQINSNILYSSLAGVAKVMIFRIILIAAFRQISLLIVKNWPPPKKQKKNKPQVSLSPRYHTALKACHNLIWRYCIFLLTIAQRFTIFETWKIIFQLYQYRYRKALYNILQKCCNNSLFLCRKRIYFAKEDIKWYLSIFI